jgi:hypothetical protein
VNWKGWFWIYTISPQQNHRVAEDKTQVDNAEGNLFSTIATPVPVLGASEDNGVS